MLIEKLEREKLKLKNDLATQQESFKQEKDDLNLKILNLNKD